MEVVDASAKDSSQKADQINTATQLTIATVEEVYTSIVFNNAKNIFDSMGKAAEIFLGGAEIVIGITLELGSLPLGVIAGIGTFGVTGGSALSISPALVAGTATAVVAKNAGATLVENGNIHLSQANDDDFSSSEKRSNSSNELKNVYNSIKESPNYPKDFEPVKNGTKKVNINNGEVYDKLRQVESGKWSKVYKDGYDSMGNKVSIHYFQSESGKVFDVKVKNYWSNPH